MLHTRRLPPSLFFAILIGIPLVIWLAETEQSLRKSAPADVNRDADYYMENFHLSETDENGHILRQLSGDRLAYYTNHHTELLAPKLILNQAENQRWRITADKGQLDHSYLLTLQDNVHIQELDVPASKQLQVLAQNLYIDTQSHESSSDSLVEIRQSNTTIEAQGMHLMLDSRQLQLRSRVRGTYVQP